MRTIALRLDPETRHKLELLAQATGYQHELLVAEAVRRFVDAELEALAAMKAADENGSGEPDKAAPPPLPENWKIIV